MARNTQDNINTLIHIRSWVCRLPFGSNRVRLKYIFIPAICHEHCLTNSKELVLDGKYGEKYTGHFKCSIDSKYIGELQMCVVMYFHSDVS